MISIRICNLEKKVKQVKSHPHEQQIEIKEVKYLRSCALYHI